MRRDETDAAYFSRRAAAEHAAAEAAKHERARDVHRELAGLYRRRAADGGREASVNA